MAEHWSEGLLVESVKGLGGAAGTVFGVLGAAVVWMLPAAGWRCLDGRQSPSETSSCSNKLVEIPGFGVVMEMVPATVFVGGLCVIAGLVIGGLVVWSRERHAS